MGVASRRRYDVVVGEASPAQTVYSGWEVSGV